MKIGLSDRVKGYYRDNEIRDRITRHKCLNAEQIQCLLFYGMKSGKRKCQQRLKKLTDTGKLKRWRYSLEEPYAYYTDFTSKVEQMEHTIGLNWVLIWLEKRLKSWEEIYSFSFEIDYKILRADAFVCIRNTATEKFKFFFVEMDRAHPGNHFDKVKKYNDLYESNLNGQWWIKLTNRFPCIIIATTTEKQFKRVLKSIKTENRNGLEFHVYLVQKLKQEVINCEV